MRRGLAGAATDGSTVKLLVWVTAPAGTFSVTTPSGVVNVVPFGDTSDPFFTLTSTEAVWPSTDAVIVALPTATPVTSPATTVAFDWSLLDHVVMRSTS